jgi:HK97 family phage major capsid protein
MSKYIELPNHHSGAQMQNGPRRQEEVDLVDLAERAETLMRMADLEKRPLTVDEGRLFDEISAQFDHIEKGLSRREFLDKIAEPLPRVTEPQQPGGRGGSKFEDRASVTLENGTRVPLLRNNESLSSYSGGRRQGDFTLADFTMANLGMIQPMATTSSSTATVSPWIAARLIDAVRAQSVIIRAGAGTIPISGPTTMARITADPVVYEHSEAQADISESDLTLSPVSLNPKYLIAAVPISAELFEDSGNIEQALQMSISAAIAQKLDSLILAAILADTAIPDSAAGQPCGTWAGTLAAIGSALAADQQLPSALISSPADFIARAGQTARNVAETENVGGFLGRPAVLEGMADLFTSKLTAGTAIFGDFYNAVAVAMRQDIRLEIIRWSKHLSATHLLYAHCRMGGVILQAKKLYIQKTTV